MNFDLWLLTAFFAVVMGSILCVGYLVVMRKKNKAPAESAEQTAPSIDFDDVQLPGSRKLLAKTFQAVGESVPASKQDNEPLRKRLSMAGYRWPTAVTIFYGIKVAAALGLAGFTGWTILFLNGSSESTLIPVVCAAGFGYLFPDRVLDRRIKSRARRIRSGLPPAVDLMVLAVEAGQPRDQAMVDVAKALSRAYPDLCEEFLVFHLEVRAGKSREDALRALADRSPDSELRKLVTLLIDGDRYGTSLGPALRTHSRFLRTRIRQQAQEQARKLTVKLTMPTFFLIFPAVLVVTLGPAYLLLRVGLGRMLNAW